MRLRAFLLGIPLLALSIFSAAPAFAAAPQFDSGAQINQTDVYGNAQSAGDVYESHAVYGKLEGALPFDVYSITPSHDGDQVVTLLGKAEANGDVPGLIFVDSTSSTQASSQLTNFPLPSQDYHPVVVKAADPGATYKEAALFQDYTLVAQDTFHLQKGKTYYFFVASADQVHPSVRYAIKFGSGQAWTAGDVFKHFGSWLRLQTDAYAGTSPFHVITTTLGFLLMILGLFLLTGTLALYATFFFLANRAKSAGYLLVKMQQYYRVITWVGLWFAAVGAYAYFDKVTWLGVPFIGGIFFLLFLVLQLLSTFRLSPRIAALEVTKREATIPRELSRPIMLNLILSLILIVVVMFFLAMYVTIR